MKIIKEIFGKDERIISYASADDRFAKRALINAVELLTGRRRVEKIYERLQALHREGAYIWDDVLDLFEITLEYPQDQLKHISSSGPLLIVSNHPFGVIDGLALGHLISRQRDDFNLIVNSVLFRDHMLKKYLLPIDFANTREALNINMNTRRQAIDFIRHNGAVAIFPSGGVATAPHIFARATELEWKNFILKIIRQTDATIVPVCFGGQNSSLFQLASHVNINLRLGLLLNEVNNKRLKSIRVNIGKPFDRAHFSNKPAVEILNYLKNTTLTLGKK